jgi:hypothetical protein
LIPLKILDLYSITNLNLFLVDSSKFNQSFNIFSSQIHGQGIYDDYSMTAIGS